MAGHDLSKQGDAQLTFEHFNVPTIRQLHTRQSREERGNGAKAHVSRRHLTLREIKAPFWIGRPALHASSPPTVLLGVARTRKLKIVRPADTTPHQWPCPGLRCVLRPPLPAAGSLRFRTGPQMLYNTSHTCWFTLTRCYR
jgi:hypothetical protein